MPPFHTCSRCNREVEHVWYISGSGMLCDDCNLECGIFYGFVVDVMLGFSDYIKWSYRRETPNKRLRIGVLANRWEGEIAV